jgi:PAS domain S-box-containing protein
VTSPIEELLRTTLDRLSRQEQRTALLEAALLDAQPTLFPPRGAPAITETPVGRDAETVGTSRPRRDSEERPRPPRTEPSHNSPSAVSSTAVLSSLDGVVWSVSPDGQFVFFVAGAVERIFGVTGHELSDGRGRWLDAVPPDDRQRLQAALSRLPEADVFTLEHRIGQAAGSIRWVVTRGKLVRDRDGRPLRVDGTTADVTRQARARNAVFDVLNGAGPACGGEFLAKLAHHLCLAYDARAALVVEPHESGPNSARAAVACINGQPAEPFAIPATTTLLRELLSGGRVFAPSVALTRFPNDPLLLQLRAEAFAAEPLVDSRGRLLGFLAVADDRPFTAECDPRAILRALAPRAAVELSRMHEGRDRGSELAEADRRARDAETAARGAERLAAVGRMAVGLAHDFNNLLGVVVGNADLIRESLPEGDPRRETAEVIARTAESVAAMNRKLLSVGRPGPARAAPHDVASAIRGLEPMLHRLVGSRISFTCDLAPGLPRISADTTQFERVIFNLILNARDAIEAAARKPGAVAVRAAAVAVEANRPGWPGEYPPGTYIAITVADNGCGMSADVRAKMFERFFTTKGERGTGLGLATVQEIVAAARGHIEVESDPAWGTQVRVYWPATTEAPQLRVMG